MDANELSKIRIRIQNIIGLREIAESYKNGSVPGREALAQLSLAERDLVQYMINIGLAD